MSSYKIGTMTVVVFLIYSDPSYDAHSTDHADMVVKPRPAS